MDSSSSYMVAVFLWSALGGLLVYHVLKKLLLFQRMPPGPYFIPYIGSIFYFLRNDAITVFDTYKKKYGNIFSLSAGNFNLIVVNGYKTVQEGLKREEFQSRPEYTLWKERNFGIKNRGILFCDGGPVWQEQRRFTLRSLRNFGFGKTSMEGLLLHEMNELINILGKSVGKPTSLGGAFNSSVLNSLWCILTGKRIELDDPEFIEAISLLNTSVQHTDLITPALFWLWPVKSGLIARERYKTGMRMRTVIRSLVKGIVDEHLSTHQDGIVRDFIDAYIGHMRKTDDSSSSFHDEEGKLNLQVLLLDLFVAGAETTSTTLLWSILYLILNPHVQEKIQSEIDNVIGNREPTRDDKPKMIYTEAFFNEVHRMCSLLPVSVYHAAAQDTEIEGYFVPKGSVVFFNLYDAHHDPTYWESPNEFRPERFLDESGKKMVKYEALMPFSFGKRQCLGESLARDTLFIFLIGMLQRYTFTVDPETKPEEPLRGRATFVTGPKPYNVIISPRA